LRSGLTAILVPAGRARGRSQQVENQTTDIRVVEVPPADRLVNNATLPIDIRTSCRLNPGCCTRQDISPVSGSRNGCTSSAVTGSDGSNSSHNNNGSRRVKLIVSILRDAPINMPQARTMSSAWCLLIRVARKYAMSLDIGTGMSAEQLIIRHRFRGQARSYRYNCSFSRCS